VADIPATVTELPDAPRPAPEPERVAEQPVTV
jgi:hypothetical protein